MHTITIVQQGDTPHLTQSRFGGMTLYLTIEVEVIPRIGERYIHQQYGPEQTRYIEGVVMDVRHFSMPRSPKVGIHVILSDRKQSQFDSIMDNDLPDGLQKSGGLEE